MSITTKEQEAVNQFNIELANFTLINDPSGADLCAAYEVKDKLSEVYHGFKEQFESEYAAELDNICTIMTDIRQLPIEMRSPIVQTARSEFTKIAVKFGIN